MQFCLCAWQLDPQLSIVPMHVAAIENRAPRGGDGFEVPFQKAVGLALSWVLPSFPLCQQTYLHVLVTRPWEP